VLCQFFERGVAEHVPTGGEFTPYRQGCVVTAQLLLEECDVPHGSEEQLVPESFFDRAAEQDERVFVPFCAAQPTGQAHHRRAVCEGNFLRGAKRVGDDGGETGQRENIERVVVENGDDPPCFAGPQIFEVDVRNQLAGQITFAFD